MLDSKKWVENQPMKTGDYDEIILFVDWTPDLICPEPTRLQVPSLIARS